MQKLIEAGGRAYLINRIWQRSGILPSEIWKMKKERPFEFAFLMASELREVDIETSRAKL